MTYRDVLLISDGSGWSQHCYDYLTRNFASVDWCAWDYGTPFPRSFDHWPGCDLLLSFKSDFIIPVAMLEKVRGPALNFHPSVPQYRGIGGYHYALEEGLQEFSATCHHINAAIDAGPIVNVSRFDIHVDETVESLSARTAAVALGQFYWTVDILTRGQELPRAAETWGERLYTRAMLAAEPVG